MSPEQDVRIGLVEDDDVVEIDATRNLITLHVDETTLAKRREAWKRPEPKATKGALYKYMKCVRTAAEGCVTDE